jgi:hypothetical protein
MVCIPGHSTVSSRKDLVRMSTFHPTAPIATDIANGSNGAKAQATGVLSDRSLTSDLRTRYPDAARSAVLWLLSSGVMASAIVGSLFACGFYLLTIPAAEVQATKQRTETAAPLPRQFVLPKTTALIPPMQAALTHDIPAPAQPATLQRTTTLLSPSADAASALDLDRLLAQCTYPSTASLCEQATLPHEATPTLRKKPFLPNQATLTPPKRILSAHRAHLAPPKQTSSPRQATLTPPDQ